MVEGLQRAWSRTGYTGSLEDRWNSAVARLRKLSPTASVGGPRTETNLDVLEAEIARLVQPPPADGPALKAAIDELVNCRQRYHRAWLDVRGLQTTLRRSASSAVHQLLADIPGDAFSDVGEAIEQGSMWGKYHSAREARAAVAELLPRVLAMEGRAAQLVAALNTASEPDEVLNRKLILKLWDRVQELEQKIGQLQAPAATARDRAIAAIAENPSRSDRAIADELGIGKDTVRRARDKLTGAT